MDFFLVVWQISLQQFVCQNSWGSSLLRFQKSREVNQLSFWQAFDTHQSMSQIEHARRRRPKSHHWWVSSCYNLIFYINFAEGDNKGIKSSIPQVNLTFCTETILNEYSEKLNLESSFLCWLSPFACWDLLVIFYPWFHYWIIAFDALLGVFFWQGFVLRLFQRRSHSVFRSFNVLRVEA